MSELPKTWVDVKGSNLFSLVRGVSYEKQDVCTQPAEGLVPILRANNIQNGEIIANDLVFVPSRYVKEEQYLRLGDILIATSSGSRDIVGKTAQAKTEHTNFAFGTFCCVARPRMYIHAGWLYFYTRSSEYRRYVEEVALGININNFRTRDLEVLPLLLPPFNEQCRIVAKLDRLFTRSRRARQELERIPKLIQRYKQAVLAAAFRGDLTADWREENPDAEPALELLKRIQEKRQEKNELSHQTRKSSKFAHNITIFNDVNENFKDIPITWDACRIGDIGDVCNGSTPSRKSSEYWIGKINWVSSGEVRNNIILRTKETITQQGYENSSVRILPAGTVLLAMIGEGKTRGQTAILRIEATINQNIAGVIIKHGLISSEYLWYWFQYQYESTREQGSGSGPQALNCQRVRELPFVVPPLEEQKEIVQRVEKLFKAIDLMEQEYQKASKLCDRLEQATLAKAFRGELVPQDPNDEPASVLLERILAEKPDQPNSKAVKSKKSQSRGIS